MTLDFIAQFTVIKKNKSFYYNSNNLKEKIPLDELFYERGENVRNRLSEIKSTWK